MNENQGLMMILGGEMKPLGLTSDGGCVVFTPMQMHFIQNLQKLKNITAAALSVGWKEDMASAFLSSRKFKKYVASRMQAFSVQAGMTAEGWWQFCRNLADGYIEKARGRCGICKWADEVSLYEVACARGDDMRLDFRCPQCGTQAEIEVEKEPFKPTREQVVGWQEWGQRVLPKIERVQHQFESSEIVFESEGGGRS